MDRSHSSNNNDKSKEALNKSKAAKDLIKMRRKYGLLDRQVSEEQIGVLSPAESDELYTVKHQIKDLEPDLKAYLQKDLDIFWKHLVNPKRFYKEVFEALKNRREVSSFIETGTIDQKAEEIIKELKRVHKVLMDDLGRLKRPEIGIEELNDLTNKELEAFSSKKQNFKRYEQTMNDNERAKFQRILESAEKYSTAISTIKSSSQGDRDLRMAKAFIKLADANRKLSEITEKQQPPEEIPTSFIGQQEDNFEHSIGYHMYIAKKGLDRLKRSYDHGIPEWKKLLTSNTVQGALIRAMYLGLKPMIEGFGAIKPEELNQIRNLYQQHAKEDFHIASGQLFLIYVESSVKKVLTNPKYLRYFDDYSPGSSVHEYISNLAKVDRKELTGSSLEKYDIQFGLLLGFPLQSVERFAKYNMVADSFLDQLASTKTEVPEEQTLLDNYRNSIKKGKRDNYIQKYQDKFQALISKYFPQVEKEMIKYIFSRRLSTLFGRRRVNFILDTQSSSDEDYCKKLDYIFNNSGINEYLASLQSIPKLGFWQK